MSSSSPEIPRRRPRCPFYGFHWPERAQLLVDSGGDECGLDFALHASCRMEREGMTVDFERCPVAIGMRHFLDAIGPDVKFAPAEYAGRRFVSLAEWNAQVMVPWRR